jgi:hypothetical protein
MSKQLHHQVAGPNGNDHSDFLSGVTGQECRFPFYSANSMGCEEAVCIFSAIEAVYSL